MKREKTFAGNGAPADNPRFRGAKELSFQKSDWVYQDVYFSGRDNMMGQEIVYYNNEPVWGMTYFGSSAPADAVDFLKYCLMNLSDKCRFGQRCDLAKKDYRYEDDGQGTIENFFGQERITIGSKIVHQLNYRGGIIQK